MSIESITQGKVKRQGAHLIWTGSVCGRIGGKSTGVPTAQGKNARVLIWNLSHPDDQVLTATELRMMCDTRYCVAPAHTTRRRPRLGSSAEPDTPPPHTEPVCDQCGAAIPDLPAYLRGTSVRCAACSPACVRPNSTEAMDVARKIASGEFRPDSEMVKANMAKAVRNGGLARAAKFADGDGAVTAVCTVSPEGDVNDDVAAVEEGVTVAAPSEPEVDTVPDVPIGVRMLEAAVLALLENGALTGHVKAHVACICDIYLSRGTLERSARTTKSGGDER